MQSKKLKISKIFTISLRSIGRLLGVGEGDFFEIKKINVETGEVILKAVKKDEEKC